MPRILGLGTYPILYPIHGGQRRVAAIAEFYRGLGIEYVYAAMYERRSCYAMYRGLKRHTYLSSNDYGFNSHKTSPYLTDLEAGEFARSNASAWGHFSSMIRKLSPDAVQLEQPYLWPLVERLIEEDIAAKIPIIYSSQNVEAPLKEAILVDAHVPRATVEPAIRKIENIESSISRAASLVIACTEKDGSFYKQLGSVDRVVIAPNGTSRPPQYISREYAEELARFFPDSRFAFFVSSGHPPNVRGFEEYVLRDGLFQLPPSKAIAVCGDIARGIHCSPEYRRFPRSNDVRFHFFPHVTDARLSAIKSAAHAALLPLATGGGSNLKTAEALVLGCWIVATPAAFRGYEEYCDERGVLLADTPAAFKRLIRQALMAERLELDPALLARRSELYWDRRLAKSGLREMLVQIGILTPSPQEAVATPGARWAASRAT